VFFSSAVQTAHDSYRTVGTSRAVALASTAPTLEEARARVATAAATVPVLEWRADVGDERYLDQLTQLVSPQGTSAASDGTGADESLLPNAS
jgi:phosphoribosylamine-glycine ligase